MGSMKGKRPKIDAAFGRLADMIEGGHLLAGADPVGFLDAIVRELTVLRDLRDRRGPEGMMESISFLVQSISTVKELLTQLAGYTLPDATASQRATAITRWTAHGRDVRRLLPATTHESRIAHLAWITASDALLRCVYICDAQTLTEAAFRGAHMSEETK